MDRKESTVFVASLALVLYTLALSMVGPAASTALRNRTITNAGSMKTIGVGVYWDQSVTNPVASIDWGTLEPGLNVNRTVYIRNEGNGAATLSISTSGWNPSSASNYMTLSWNYDGKSLNVHQMVQVKLMLSVSPSVTGITNFSFDITIAASG